MEKHEFEPRITRLRQRIAALEEQRQQRIDEAALQTELRLIIGRLEDFAAQIDTGLEEADWLRKREMIRALVKRVEVTQDRSMSSFGSIRTRKRPTPKKKVCNFVGGVRSPLLALIALHGMDEAITHVYPRAWVIAYADDCVVLHEDRPVLEHCQHLLQTWLTGIGLTLNEAKSRISHTLDGDQPVVCL